MNRFPIFESIHKGIRQTWDDRAFLLSMMVMPLVVMFASAFIIMNVYDPGSLLMTAVILLPSEFLKAVFIVLYIRFLMLGEVLRPQEDAEREDKARAITGGVLAVVTVNFLFVGALQGLMVLNTAIEQGVANAYAAPTFLLMVALMGGMVWSMRFLFLYVPIALNQPIKPFFADYAGFSGSLRIFVLILGCMILMIIPTLLTDTVIGSITSGMDQESTPRAIINSIGLFLKVFIELCGAAILTAATAAAISHKGQEAR